jgi:ribosomal protein S18 acetylase RimI-like enzyme
LGFSDGLRVDLQFKVDAVQTICVGIMRIVRYASADFEEVEPLLREGTKGWGKDWREEVLLTYRAGEGEVYIVRDDGRIVGTIFLKRSVRVLVIHFLAVARADRSKGIGSALLKFAEQIARREARSMRVDVAKEFEKNADFYVKSGFKRCGRVKNFYMNGDDQIFLCKNPRRKSGEPNP